MSHNLNHNATGACEPWTETDRVAHTSISEKAGTPCSLHCAGSCNCAWTATCIQECAHALRHAANTQAGNPDSSYGIIRLPQHQLSRLTLPGVVCDRLALFSWSGLCEGFALSRLAGRARCALTFLTATSESAKRATCEGRDACAWELAESSRSTPAGVASVMGRQRLRLGGVQAAARAWRNGATAQRQGLCCSNSNRLPVALLFDRRVRHRAIAGLSPSSLALWQ